MSTIVALCECGCGEPAPISPETKRARGYVKGEPMRFICGHNTPVPRRLTPQQVRSAYTLYQHGFSVRELATRAWRRLGFSSAQACESALDRAFRSERRHLRGPSDALRLRYANRPCLGCGCHVDDRTRGCHSCENRHCRRKRLGLPYTPLWTGQCAACGCDWDERTRGCGACKSRHWRRVRRDLRRPFASAQAPPVASSGSGRALVGGGNVSAPAAPVSSSPPRRGRTPSAVKGRVAA